MIFLTETWSSECINMKVDGFELFSLHRSEKDSYSKRNSGGVAVYVKLDLIDFVSLYSTDSDDILWLKIDGSVFDLHNDIFLCLCYVVPKGSSREAFILSNIYDRVLNEMVKINSITNDNCSFIVLGDLNS